MSTEINLIPAGRCCCVGRRQNISLSIWRDFGCYCGVGEPIMLYKDSVSTWESQHSPTEKTAGMPYNQKEGKQTGRGQSDSRIVPGKAVKAAGGKPRGDNSSSPCCARQYRRGNIDHTQRWKKRWERNWREYRSYQEKTRT